jgi:hypothetical protein
MHIAGTPQDGNLGGHGQDNKQLAIPGDDEQDQEGRVRPHNINEVGKSAVSRNASSQSWQSWTSDSM